MPQNLDLEQKVITRFFERSKRDRYLQFVTSPKNRKKLLADLHSGQVFRANALEQVTGIEEQVIQQALSQQGITSRTCYIISENATLDTQTLLFPEALRQVVGWGAGTILVFGEAEVIFVELDGLRNRYISKPQLLMR
ncbi:MAG: hypothetical protein ACRYG7_12070 [Janthinobacterium lividum]